MTFVLEMLALVGLLLLNAFFVAAEYGLVTSRRTRIMELEHEGNRRARAVLRITADPPRFISAMQLGVTISSLAIGALGEQVLAHQFDAVMASFLAVILALLIVTYLHVVIGELVPKGIALGHPERTALAVSAPVRAFFIVFRPLIWLLQESTERDPARSSASSRPAPSTRPTRRPSCACSSRAPPSRARSSTTSRRCSTRSSTSPTRKSRT